MYIEISKPEVLGEGFSGNILFYEEEPGRFVGIALDHSLCASGPTLEEAQKQIKLLLEFFLEDCIAEGAEANIFCPSAPEYWVRLAGGRRLEDIEVRTKVKGSRISTALQTSYRAVTPAFGIEKRAA